MIYFDHNASTPIHDEVLAEMMPYLQRNFANPSSIHQQGRVARQAIENAREQVAKLINAHSSQIIFTGGGSEANNLAISGCVRGMGLSRLMVGATEHPSVKDAADYFSTTIKLDTLMVNSQGLVDDEALKRISKKTGKGLVTVMMANNETGVIQDIEKIINIVQADDHFVHTDAIQAVGKMPIDFAKLKINLLSISAHKMYGPKGIGALVFDKRIDLEPMIYGGGQEKNRRSGTENVAAIVGFGKAAELSRLNLKSNVKKLKKLQNYFEKQLQQIPGVIIFSENVKRLPNTTFFGLAGIDGETLLMQLDVQGIAVTSGSACSSNHLKPSHVLLAMGISEQCARSAIRVSFGHHNTEAEIDRLIQALKMQVEMLATLKSIEI